jgi:hypothetical protein
LQPRKLIPLFALTVATGVLYLIDAWFASIALEPCTSAGPATSFSPCGESVAIIGWVSVLGIAILILGMALFAVLRYARFRLVWSGFVIGATLAGYILLLTLVPLNGGSPIANAYYAFGLLFLPALASGLVAGRVGLDLNPRRLGRSAAG